MDKFYIVLMHCKDYGNIHYYPEYLVPSIPNESQIIYVETGMKNEDWEQVFASFIANDEYDMVWIFPKQNMETTIILGVDFTGLVLKPTEINCSNLPPAGCSHIPNPQFGPQTIIATSPLYNAFANNLVNSWGDTHGTTDIFGLNTPLPTQGPPTTNYARMAVGSSYDDITNSFVPYSEGIAVPIRPLVFGRTYALSFFLATESFNNINVAQNVNFNVALIPCQTFQIMSGVPPPLPAQSQIIYCENFQSIPIGNSLWRQVFVTFNADFAYTMIRIYPDQLILPPLQNSSASSIYFSFPELIDITGFTAGISPTTTPPNCNVTIGPTVPNCGVTGSIFTWVGPNNQTQIVPSSNQQLFNINTNNPMNVGTWTLTSSVPSAVATNNTCSQTGIIQATVNVPACCSTNISPAGTVEYYTPNLENDLNLTFTSNKPTGNQWYVDGNPVSGATNQTFVYNWVNGNSPAQETHTIHVVNGCASASTTVKFINYILANNCPGWYPLSTHCSPTGINTPYSVCPNTMSYMQTFNLGGQANYSWQLTNVGGGSSNSTISITSQNQNVAQISVSGSTTNFGGAYEVIAKSEINGVTKYFQYTILISIDNSIAGNGAGNGTGFIYFNMASIILWDLQMDCLISGLQLLLLFLQCNHHYYSSGSILYANMATLNSVTLTRNGSSTYKVKFSNNTNDDCSQSNVSLDAYRTTFYSDYSSDNKFNVGVKLNKQLTFFDSKVNCKIKVLSIFNLQGQLVSKITQNNEILLFLNLSSVKGLNSGIYVIKVHYMDGSNKVIKGFINPY